MTDENDTQQKRKSSARSSSFFTRTRKSFLKSNGERGASPKVLRGTKGADFESQGKIHRGDKGISCGCFGGRGEEGKDRLILVKGPFCFVFDSEDSPAPKYAIGLQNMKGTVHKAGSSLRMSSSGTAVLLESSLGDVEYEISFATEEVAIKFANTVKTQAAAAVSAQVRKRLGHEHLLTKRASVRYAETIAQKKVEDQPETPVTTQEVLDNMPLQGVE